MLLGARMSTEEVAATPWSDGCQNGLQTCVSINKWPCLYAKYYYWYAIKILTYILLYFPLNTQICPRETICADSLASMIYLTIARCSAWFDYPLYMVLFLSKCDNLNNLMQRTSLRVWLNFSEVCLSKSVMQNIYLYHSFFNIPPFYTIIYSSQTWKYHHCHTLFGIIVGIETLSHSFFHILRWATRNDDIQVRFLYIVPYLSHLQVIQ